MDTTRHNSLAEADVETIAKPSPASVTPLNPSACLSSAAVKVGVAARSVDGVTQAASAINGRRTSARGITGMPQALLRGSRGRLRSDHLAEVATGRPAVLWRERSHHAPLHLRVTLQGRWALMLLRVPKVRMALTARRGLMHRKVRKVLMQRKAQMVPKVQMARRQATARMGQMALTRKRHRRPLQPNLPEVQESPG